MRRVDIKWGTAGRLIANLRWSNKKSGLSFFLIPASIAECEKCPFNKNPFCEKWKIYKRVYVGLCTELWGLSGDNRFEGRSLIRGWQPIGPLKRKRIG